MDLFLYRLRLVSSTLNMITTNLKIQYRSAPGYTSAFVYLRSAGLDPDLNHQENTHIHTHTDAHTHTLMPP